MLSFVIFSMGNWYLVVKLTNSVHTRRSRPRSSQYSGERGTKTLRRLRKRSWHSECQYSCPPFWVQIHLVQLSSPTRTEALEQTLCRYVEVHGLPVHLDSRVLLVVRWRSGAHYDGIKCDMTGTKLDDNSIIACVPIMVGPPTDCPTPSKQGGLPDDTEEKYCEEWELETTVRSMETIPPVVQSDHNLRVNQIWSNNQILIITLTSSGRTTFGD